MSSERIQRPASLPLSVLLSLSAAQWVDAQHAVHSWLAPSCILLVLALLTWSLHFSPQTGPAGTCPMCSIAAYCCAPEMAGMLGGTTVALSAVRMIHASCQPLHAEPASH